MQELVWSSHRAMSILTVPKLIYSTLWYMPKYLYVLLYSIPVSIENASPIAQEDRAPDRS